MVKISGDELGNVKSVIEKLEKGRGIFQNMSWQSEKVSFKVI